MTARVHVTGRIPEGVLNALRADFELAAQPDDVDGVLSVVTTRVDSAFLDRAGPRLRVVANYGAGVDNVDLAAARARGIAVTNTPDAVTRPTAELTVGLVLALLRRIAEGDRFVRSGVQWRAEYDFMLGESLDGKLVGIVGPGRIGRATGVLFGAMGARIRYIGRDDPLDSQLGEFDVLSLHCPLTEVTHHLIGRTQFELMRPSAVLVNVARGPVVSEQALVEALQAGRIAGAALDVFEYEPVVSDELRRSEKVVLAPHIGSATRSAREAMAFDALHALRDVLLTGTVPRTLVRAA